ncbi:MAG: DUF975 family protein [Lachnospiraceae bacterium]|nr:DUF975 family protein [Lachnospiraceae bacterium]
MMKVREIKALARETLIGRYGTLIIAGILSALLILLSAAIALAGLAAAVNWSGILAGPDGQGVRITAPGIDATINSPVQASVPLMAAGVMVFTLFLILTVILVIWLGIGKRKLMLNICRGDKYGIGDIFYGFSAEAHPFRVILTSIARFLIHNLVGLIALGILAGIQYASAHSAAATPQQFRIILYVALAVLILIQLNVDLGFAFAELSIIDRPETRIGAALGHSRAVTKGRKIKLIWMMTFSFIFWILLMSICRFTALWIVPYIRAAFTVLYLDGDGSAWQIPANRPSYQAAAVTAPEPVPAPQPESAAQPENAPQPESEPTLQPEPVPAPQPEPEPTPQPEPVPVSEPEPAAAAEPVPVPAAEPVPVTAPDPVPAPVPAAEEIPAPAAAAPAAVPEPAPAAPLGEESAFDKWFKDAYKEVLEKPAGAGTDQT